MEQPPPFSPLEPALEAPAAAPMSLAARLANVIAAPGEVFDRLKSSPPSAANWLIPIVLFVLVSWVGFGLVFSQDTIKQQLTEMTDAAIQKQIEKTHMPEQAAEQMRSISVMSQKVMFVIQPVFMGFTSPFVWGLFVWLLGAKAFQGGFSYMKAVEAVGLGNMIGVLEAVVRILLVLALGNLFASPSLALLVKNFDPQNPVHGALTVVNVMTFWMLGVRALGMARLSGVSWIKAAACVFGFWAAYTGFFVGVGFLVHFVMKRATG